MVRIYKWMDEKVIGGLELLFWRLFDLYIEDICVLFRGFILRLFFFFDVFFNKDGNLVF